MWSIEGGIPGLIATMNLVELWTGSFFVVLAVCFAVAGYTLGMAYLGRLVRWWLESFQAPVSGWACQRSSIEGALVDT